MPTCGLVPLLTRLNRYWDWSANCEIPAVTMQEQITVYVPGDAPGKKTPLTIDPNPLYVYKFTSIYADQQVQLTMQWETVSA
jgi:hypothetical protein